MKTFLKALAHPCASFVVLGEMTADWVCRAEMQRDLDRLQRSRASLLKSSALPAVADPLMKRHDAYIADLQFSLSATFQDRLERKLAAPATAETVAPDEAKL
jgi:hypothetical protein